MSKKFGGPVLELACGTGRLTIPLAKAGAKITGLDASEAMLGVFREKLGKESEEVRERVVLKKGDMREFDFRHKFGFAFVPFNSFLHLETVEDEEKCVRAVHRNLKPGGIFVVDVFKPMFKDYPENVFRVDLTRTDPETGITISRLSSRTYEHGKQLIHAKYYVDVIFPEGKARRHETGFTLRYVKAKEMVVLLERCGFRVEKIYGGYDFSPFTPLSKKMIFVARKRS